jgi:KUP system potassium uptake protein
VSVESGDRNGATAPAAGVVDATLPPNSVAGAVSASSTDVPAAGVPLAIDPGSRRDEGEGHRRESLLSLSIAALGVVYGDIGTSPLYALRQCFLSEHGVAPTAENVLGVLSLITWSLILVISVKYLLFILSADNRGEGGIIALVALLNPWRAPKRSRKYVLMLLGLFGASLLYGDGTITPAISVLSAVEGLKVATSAFDHLVVPLTVLILVVLFAMQWRGTHKIGILFGPVMVVWFLTLAVLGIAKLIDAPQVLWALNPLHAFTFLTSNGLLGFTILGTVFLVVTGGEALYADMGHFGPKPIRVTWFVLCLPCLLLNYYGQGALVLGDPAQVERSFYGLAPSWGLYPLVALATMATVIASQAIISGTFSLTRQAMQLGQLPRFTIIQTSSQHIGQIYVPAINWMLMIATIGLVLGFQSSERLASAYGVAVSTDMVITTVLAYFVARRWGWSPWLAGGLALIFFTIDISFLGSNLFKIADGGWYPLLVGALIFSIMGIWRAGRGKLSAHLSEIRESLTPFLARLDKSRVTRVPGIAVFMTPTSSEAPTLLLHHLKHNQVLHKRVVLLTIVVEDHPRVPTANRLELTELAPDFHRLIVHYGFMQSPNVPVALKLCSRLGLNIDPEKATYYLGNEDIVPASDEPGLDRWQAQVFAFLQRNAARATAFYNIPANRVVQLGSVVEI